ncbi:hypothetical protein SAMN05216338_1004311 [Bradyrhizobium sp. Rc2d]|uniref:hypothetical protein n=1 Tax=Bradyrhizobium sp. Rc2d TaxID=1855321 RepID=UPI00087E2384|nr:hypothetical protein [Bradyrhizobium sp. Rc2d]SDH02139.1 hypothetical protein SAMN05216338_1004311 [Bradyrhizobium sp. Rc2d]
MSGHLRFCFTGCLLLAGLSTSPAFSNPFADFFNASPAQATAPAPATEECLSQPGKSTADGQHWVYRFDGHRKCWFQAAAGTATAKKPHGQAARHRVPAAEKNETALRKRKAIVDARAELLRSAAAETPQPTPPTPEFKVADAAPVLATWAAALVPEPVVPMTATDQLMPDRPIPRQVDVGTLLAAAPAASEAVAASVPPAPVAFPVAEAADDGRGWTATWLGVLLMVLGLVFILSSSRTVRGHYWLGDFSM